MTHDPTAAQTNPPQAESTQAKSTRAKSTRANAKSGDTGGIDVRAVDGRRDRRAFLKFERDLYRDDPMWVPPIWDERKRLVGFKPHPFYNDAEATAMLARRDGVVVGRVVAITNHAHNRYHKENLGFFGFFECVDDPDVAAALMSAVEQHHRRDNRDAVRGPVHPSLNYECGALVATDGAPPTFLIPHNHLYYDRLFKSCGYEKAQDVYCYDAHIEMLKNMDPKLKFVIEEATRRFNVTARPLSRKDFKRDIKIFLDLYNRSLSKTWGYVPISDGEMQHQAAGLKHLLVPQMTSIAEIDGEPVGAGFGLLDYNPIIKKIGGRLTPWGIARLLLGRKHLKRLRLVSANVLPEYQRWGLGLVTLARTLPGAIDYGIEIGEFSWILESNKLSWGTAERGGAHRTKTLRIYDKPLERGDRPAAAEAST